jgi:hypothetical protein
VHNVAAEHGHGVTAETSVVEPATQATVDAAERPGAPTENPSTPEPANPVVAADNAGEVNS